MKAPGVSTAVQSHHVETYVQEDLDGKYHSSTRATQLIPSRTCFCHSPVGRSDIPDSLRTVTNKARSTCDILCCAIEATESSDSAPSRQTVNWTDGDLYLSNLYAHLILLLRGKSLAFSRILSEDMPHKCSNSACFARLGEFFCGFTPPRRRVPATRQLLHTLQSSARCISMKRDETAVR